MLTDFLLAHPRSLGETYFGHAATATRFGTTMVVGGVACLVHAVLPAFFQTSASDRIKALYGEMKSRQPAFSGQLPSFRSAEWQVEYEI